MAQPSGGGDWLALATGGVGAAIASSVLGWLFGRRRARAEAARIEAETVTPEERLHSLNIKGFEALMAATERRNGELVESLEAMSAEIRAGRQSIRELTRENAILVEEVSRLRATLAAQGEEIEALNRHVDLLTDELKKIAPDRAPPAPRRRARRAAANAYAPEPSGALEACAPAEDISTQKDL